jgi:RNA polymerase sigma factor (sigma-70 family)
MTDPIDRGPEGGSPAVELDEVTQLAVRAQSGDAQALEELCRRLHAPMYRLALRFSGHPVDAQDATQEIMIRLVTHLSSFEGRSRFTTWAYTVATRQLVRTAQRPTEASVLGPVEFVEFLDRNRAVDSWDASDEVVYAELCADVRLSCTYGMLLCLNREQRLAYLMGDLLGFTDRDAAEICDTTPPAFRQRLARARHTMRELMGGHCGLVRASNPCRCNRLVGASINHGLLDPKNPRWARHAGVTLPIATETLQQAANELDLAVAVAEVYKSDPAFAAPAELWDALKSSLPELLGT